MMRVGNIGERKINQALSYALVVACALSCLCARAQQNLIFNEQIRTLQLVVDDNPLLPPVMELGRHHHVEISWDEMSHEYHRYLYHVQHCESDWTPSDGIFESDYMQGNNDQPVEDYEKSFNTVQLYTHYSLRFPNEQVGFILSGNYRILVYEEGSEPDDPVLEACFSLYENQVSLRTEVSSNTDMDFNKNHQQLTLAMGYGVLSVTDPAREFSMVVMQNRRWDNKVVNPVANIRKQNGVEFTHNRQLIFPAGNEFHKFEILDVQRTSMGVDDMEWFEPYYHATLYPHRPAHNYDYDEDQNGIYVLRSSDDTDDAITAEYVFVHFILQSPRLPGGDVYVCGQWTNGSFDPDCRMEYDEAKQQYEVAVLLKQGYYDYQFRQADGATSRTMGDFYETENEYSVLVYYRAQGARTDRLVGYQRSNVNDQ